MSVPGGSDIMEFRQGHKRQQSQDSGTYIDWNSEDSSPSPTGSDNYIESKVNGEFVTVVAVESDKDNETQSSFVTILSIGEQDQPVADSECVEQVLVYRLPGERLGFGLKFEGGTNTSEKVKRLFIQSSAPDSPASRAQCSWGTLIEGDEILGIDNVAVKDMTRLDCVRSLKESNVVIKLNVRHPGKINHTTNTPLVVSAEVKKRTPPPPPIPPRKIPRKSPAPPPKESSTPVVVGPPDGFTDSEEKNIKTPPIKQPLRVPPTSPRAILREKQRQTSPDVCRQVVRRNSLKLESGSAPPEAEVYLDLLAQEELTCNGESESDDTSSSISTIVGFSTSNSSFSDLRSSAASSICDSTTPSTPTTAHHTHVLDLSEVLGPYENLEREFDRYPPVNDDFLFTKLVTNEQHDHVSVSKVTTDEDLPLQPPLSFQDAPLSYGNEEVRSPLHEYDQQLVPSIRNCTDDDFEEIELSNKENSQKVSSPKKSSLIPRLAKSIGLLSPPKAAPRKEVEGKGKINKKRPPPPPPPPKQEPSKAKTSIPYLKKKKSTKEEKKKIEKVKKASKELDEPKYLQNEVKFLPEKEASVSDGSLDSLENLSWPVPEMRTSKTEEPCLVTNTDSPEANILEDDTFLPNSASVEFGIEAVTSRDPFFLFQWGVSKQLETIGEDEEEANNEEEEDEEEEEREETREIVEEDTLTTLNLCNDQTLPGIQDNPVQDELKIEECNGESIVDESSSDNVIVEDMIVEDVQTEVNCEDNLVEESATELKDNDNVSTSANVEESTETVTDKTMDSLVSTLASPCTASHRPPPPPSFNRLPPDGHEFPPNYQEEIIDMPAKMNEYYNDLKQESLAPPLPPSGPPTQRRYSYRFDNENTPTVRNNNRTGSGDWRKDEKSEKSVKDKIAMFSSVTDTPPVSPCCKLSKYKSSEDVFYDDETDCTTTLPASKLFSRSVVSVDKIGNTRKSNGYNGLSEMTDNNNVYTTRTQSSMDLTLSSSSSSSAYSSSCSPDSSLSSTTSSSLYMVGYSSTLPKKTPVKCDNKTTGLSRTTSFTNGSNTLHTRSHSLVDVNCGLNNKLRSSPAGDPLNTLIEQRRKNMTKLRGLVIPEKCAENNVPSQKIFDLPEIKSKDSILTKTVSTKEKYSTVNQWDKPTNNKNHAKINNYKPSTWKVQTQLPSVPKYSPAFKRKSFSVYSSSCITPPTKEMTISQPKTSPRGKSESYLEEKDSRKEIEKKHGEEIIKKNSYSRHLSDTAKSEDDSDNDSAVSSSRSSMSHEYSPPSSPSLDHRTTDSDSTHMILSPTQSGDKRPLSRTHSSDTTASAASSTGSTLTSGSQASCSSNGSSDGNKRILKPQSVEAINRKNVLTSAKYSRGFDAKCGSPLIQRKFSEGSVDDQEDAGSEDKESVLSFESSHTLESYPNGESSFRDETINYQLAENYTNCDHLSDVKIAFLNNIDSIDGGDELLDKKKVMKSDSVPSTDCPSIPQPAPRRTSVPLINNHKDDIKSFKNEIKEENNFISQLPFKNSSESLRSRTSSIDTIVDRCDEYRSSRLSSRSSIDSDILCKSTTGQEVGDVMNNTTYRIRRSVDMSDTSILPNRISPSRGGDSDTKTKNRRSVSVNDIRRAFEKAELAVSNNSNGNTQTNNVKSTSSPVKQQQQPASNHVRVSSIDSSTSDDSCALTAESGSNLHREQFGSITSLASSTSLISPQELQLLIDDANQTLEESVGGCSGGSSVSNHDVLVVILHRDTAGGSVGITLAGGADYEAKEITVHKVLAGSPADRDGRIQKGDRILSINGRSMKGVSHRESLAILKSPRPEVVLVVSRLKAESTNIEENIQTSIRTSLNGGSTRPPRILEGTTLNTQSVTSCVEDVARGPPLTLTLIKDGAGLGFSLEGGKDSPLGDKPLVVKKIFTGGAAEKCGQLQVMDEILSVNGIDVVPMSRIEAWKLMKRLPDGQVNITIRHSVVNRS